MLLLIAGALFVVVVSGLLMGWQMAPAFVLFYFAVGWASKQGQKQKRQTDAYREQWLNERKSRNEGDSSPPD